MELVFQKIQKWDILKPHNFGKFALPKFGLRAFVKFRFYRQIQSTKINRNCRNLKILSKFVKIFNQIFPFNLILNICTDFNSVN